jgi:cyclophilin family peptidyl-prolyl cis-trans isomerase/HEAT repeat protein
MRRSLPSLVVLVLMAAACPVPLHAQSRADSALAAAVLTAEDRRDAAAPALDEAVRHPDPRLRALAARARHRIADSTFAARDSFPVPPPSRAWPEPAWRLRLRALGPRATCDALRPALADSAWPVRLRAATLAGAACPGDTTVTGTLRRWVASAPRAGARRAAGGVTWHAAAAALPSLAQLAPGEARASLPRFARHETPALRRAAARAAAALADTATLRALARDPDGNVQEQAVELLGKLAGHAEDTTYLAVLASPHPQAVRAGAAALAGSTHPETQARARATFARWRERPNDSERDVRRALLAAAGGSPAEDRAANPRPPLPPEAVALALGGEARLRVSMDPATGGGAFTVRLRGDLAPVMAARILALATGRHYDGLTWHRVEHDFVIQGGSPGANEYVGHPLFLRDELGTLAHPRGTVGMSTRGHDTGDAQWFVNLRDNPRLRGDYTVFAEVVEGIEVVDGIMEGDRMLRVEAVR